MPRRRALYWRTMSSWASDESTLRAEGVTIVPYATLFPRVEECLSASRPTIQPPATQFLEDLRNWSPVAIVDIPLVNVMDLHVVHGFFVEPAFRNDLTLYLYTSRGLEDVAESEAIDERMDFPWTLDRLRYLVGLFAVAYRVDGQPPMTPIESMLFTALAELGYSPVAQQPIGPYVADLAFPAQRVIVECDGRGYHDKDRDDARDRHLARHGWETHRFSGSQIWHDLDGVVTEVGQALAVSEARRAAAPTQPDDWPQPETPARRGFWPWLMSLLRRLFGGSVNDSTSGADTEPVDVTTVEDSPPPVWRQQLDGDQTVAVMQPDGAGQILAPAGSGKTRVLTARVSELISRGVPPSRILYVVFNKHARIEAEGRLGGRGVPVYNQRRGPGVSCATFNALGLRILREEGRLPGDGRDVVRTLSFNQWRRLGGQAAKNLTESGDNGGFVEAADLRSAISYYKLGLRWTPQDARDNAGNEFELTTAEVYRLYEQDNEQAGVIDFDDQILLAANLLRDEPDVRKRWQQEWDYVLVDEYQDIGPTQEVLVQSLAAPQDNLLVVGDEDQCIYTWRRADVRRITGFHHVYPGLTRSVLETIYRCVPPIVEHARRLIGCNEQRFDKTIRSGRALDDAEMQRMRLFRCADLDGEIARVVLLVSDALAVEDSDSRQIAVLARTTELIERAARALAKTGIYVDAPERIVERSGSPAEITVLGYLRLVNDPAAATPEDIIAAMRLPNRYGSPDLAAEVARRLNGGATFVEAFDGQDRRPFAQGPQRELAEFLDELAANVAQDPEAAEIVRLLRGPGGLERQFSLQERMSSHDQDQIDVLDRLENEDGNGVPVGELIATIETEIDLVREFCDEDGIRLRTIHGAKGSEWTHVILVGCDHGLLPHHNALEPPPTDLGDLLRPVDPVTALEEERRLTYVAMTRASDRLDVVFNETCPSQFLSEAGWDPEAATAAGSQQP